MSSDLGCDSNGLGRCCSPSCPWCRCDSMAVGRYSRTMQLDDVLHPLAQPPPQLRPLILVAEDDAPVRDLLSRVLRTRGFEVYAADNAEHAMKLATILRF